MSNSQNVPCSRFSDYSSICSDEVSSPRSPSLRVVTKTLSNLLSPGHKSSPSQPDVPYSANTSPPLHRSFADSPRTSSGSSRPASNRNVLSAFKESWKAGLSSKQELRFADDAPSSPRHAPINALQQAHNQRAARETRDAAMKAPNRVEYIWFLNRMGPPVEHCTILEDIWRHPEEEKIYMKHMFWVDEGTPNARSFF